jgi:DHA1 family inner membrane transport protein
VPRRLFTALCGLVFLVNFGRVMFAPLVEPLQGAFDVGPAAIGTVTTLVWVGSAVPRIPVGYLLTRVSRVRVVLTTGTVLVAAAALTASADSLSMLQVGAFALGVASGAYFVAAIPLVGELLPGATGRAVGIHGTASALAAVVAPLVVVSVLAELSWRAAFWLLAVAAAAVTLTLLVFVQRRPEVVPAPPAGERDFLAALGHWRVIVAGIAFVAATGLVWQGLFNFYVSFLTDGKGLADGTANRLLTVLFAAGVPAFWLSGRIVDRVPHVPYLLAINAAFLGCLVGLLYVESVVAVAVVSALLGFVLHSLFPAVDTYLLETLPRTNRASAYAVFSGLALFLESTGSGIVGLLRGLEYGFGAVFGGAAVGLAVLLVGLTLATVTGVVPTADTQAQ